MRADNNITGLLGVVVAIGGAITTNLDEVEQWVRILSGSVGFVAGVFASIYYFAKTRLTKRLLNQSEPVGETEYVSKRTTKEHRK